MTFLQIWNHEEYKSAKISREICFQNPSFYISLHLEFMDIHEKNMRK